MAQMKYYYELTISCSPHVHHRPRTQNIMLDVLIALMPALAGSVYFFGLRALMVTLVSVTACVAFEWAWCRLMKQDCKVYDLSACVTGVLLAFVCPVTIPYWMVIIGDFFAIIIVKMLFGGIGRNVVNPALAGRAFLMSWPVAMTTWVKAGWENRAGLVSTVDAVTAAQLCGGGLMLGAIFMATDYVTSPVTKLGQVVYGMGCGALTILIRYFGGYNEGVSYAILVMNCCVVLLDRIGRPTKFGAPKKEGKKV